MRQRLSVTLSVAARTLADSHQCNCLRQPLFQMHTSFSSSLMVKLDVDKDCFGSEWALTLPSEAEGQLRESHIRSERFRIRNRQSSWDLEKFRSGFSSMVYTRPLRCPLGAVQIALTKTRTIPTIRGEKAVREKANYARSLERSPEDVG